MQFSGPASGVDNAHNYKGPDKVSEAGYITFRSHHGNS